MAAAADAWMLRFQSNRREAEFYRLCDQAIERAEKILAANPNDEWAKFFLGGSDGYKGTYEVRYERYITGFRFGWKGVSVFLKMASDGSKNPDIQFGIGTYDYWRSALMKMLWWMPGVEDKRASGIQKLREVRRNGVYTKTAAAMVLVDIYINEELFQDALNVSDDVLRTYPRSLVFHWSRARALHGLKRYEDAIAAYRQIFARCENDANNNFYNLVQARMGMARSMAALGKNSDALEQLTAIGGYNLSKDIRKRLESVLTEANNLRRRVERAS
jgi:tetratricopeptide (TPR) repeat protein